MADEEWRAVALRVPVILGPISAVDEAPMDSRLPNLLHCASNELRLRRDDLASFRHGVPYVEDPLRHPVLPSTLLGRANAVLRRHHELHCAGARFLALYGEHLGFLQPAPAIERNLVFQPGQDEMADANAYWENWLQNRLEAIESKREASRKLRLAAAYDAAISDAVSIARGLPAGSPYRDPWVEAAEFLAVDAEVQTSAALDRASRMPNAVALESYNANWILGLT